MLVAKKISNPDLEKDQISIYTVTYKFILKFKILSTEQSD